MQYHLLALQVQACIHTYIHSWVRTCLLSPASHTPSVKPHLCSPRAIPLACLSAHFLISCQTHRADRPPPPPALRPPGLPPSTHVGASIGVSITCACRAPLHTVTTDHRARPNEAILPGAPNSSPLQAKPGAAALLLAQATRVPAIPRIPLPAWLGPVRNVGTPVRKGPCQFIAERATCLRNTSASSTLLLFYC